MVNEIKILAKDNKFKGTITDIGGPTANLYMAECPSWKSAGACRDKRCMMPQKCKNLKLGYNYSLRLWEELKKIPVVKHVFIGSGLRYDLLIDKYSDEYLNILCKYHISGQLKVAPEHAADSVLELVRRHYYD